LVVAPLFALVASKNEQASKVLYKGWTPVLASMCISSVGGLILDHTIKRFPRMAAFQPVMNGAGSNLAAVQASRIATHLHNQSEPGNLIEDDDSSRSRNPCSVFFGKSTHSRIARVLYMLVIPGHAIFLTVICMTAADEEAVGVNFVVLYLLAALIQEWILLFTTMHLVHSQWQWGIDPDSAAVPYLAALGDLVGTSLLIGVFVALRFVDQGENIYDLEGEVMPANITDVEDKIMQVKFAKHVLRRNLLRW